MTAVLIAALGTIGIVHQVSAADACGEGATEWRSASGAVRCIHVDTRADLLEADRAVAALAEQGLLTTADAAGSAARSSTTAAARSSWRRAVDDDRVRLVCDRSSNRHRVKVLYAYTGTNRLGSKRATLERAVAQAQSQYDRSSEFHGAGDSWIPRFVANADSSGRCRPSITAVKVAQSKVSSNDFDGFFESLEAKGFDDRDRSYLVMVDADSPHCGLGTLYPFSDSADPRVNANNQRPDAAFARVDRACWDLADRAVGHELAHNLGAVLRSAPHATNKGHCTDGLDTMCYDDGSPQSSALRDDICTNADSPYVLDCRADDYFSPNPRGSNHLRSHWNIADSDWLLRTNLRSWSRGGEVAASGTIFDDVSYADKFAVNITRLSDAGVTRGCNRPANTRFCPTDVVTRAQMAAFLKRALELPDGNVRFADVPSSSLFRDDIAALARADITRGCNPPANTRFCPDQAVTREQMAAFLDRALKLPDGSKVFSDVPSDSKFRVNIAALARRGITRGCNPPANTRFCPGDPVTRRQMAAFLDRADLLD